MAEMGGYKRFRTGSGNETMAVRKVGKKFFGLSNLNKERKKNGLKLVGRLGKLVESGSLSGKGGC